MNLDLFYRTGQGNSIFSCIQLIASLETRLSSTLCLVMAGVRRRVWPRGIGGGSGGQQKFRANQSAVSMDTAKPLLALFS